MSSNSISPVEPAEIEKNQVVQITGARIIKGVADILIVAPHGPVINGEARNDFNTGHIAQLVAEELECMAIINDEFLKPKDSEKQSFKKKKLDLNSIRQMGLHSKYNQFFQDYFRDVIKTFVVHIHGCKNENADGEAKESVKSGGYEFKPTDVQAFIGFGQGANPAYTIPKKTAENLADSLTENGLTTILVREDASNFRGRSTDNMNQYFRGKHKSNKKYSSVQIEIRETGCRDSEENIKRTADAIAQSLAQLVRPTKEVENFEKEPNDELVSEALQELKDIFTEHFHNAMLDAGRYIIDTFYGKDPHRVLKNDPVKDKSLNQLVIELKQNEGSVPSRGWFYNAVNLAAQETISQEEGFQTFGKIGHSQKLLLLPYPKLKKLQADTFEEKVKIAFGEKEKCAKYAHDNNLSVREFKKYIDEQNPSKAIDLTALPSKVELRKRDQKELVRLRNTAKKKIEDGQEKIGIYGKALNHLDAVLAEKGNKNHKGRGRFRDWTLPGNNVNIYTGCKNDCRYCYANLTAQRYQRVGPGEWSKLEVRRDDVEKSRKLLNGLVGFPSTHDIFPENLDNYLIVLGKLLRAGNEVLIVSKPNLECIKEICNASTFFKDKILFRFTIGANDDDILSFWEPNAPKYEERKASLRYARENGFRTSVSMEPMLDAPQIKKTIADLRPFVTEDIWLGTMNHLNQIKAGADERLSKEIAIIKANQAPEILSAIYEIYKDDPLIKWKTDAFKTFAAARNKKTTKN